MDIEFAYKICLLALTFLCILLENNVKFMKIIKADDFFTKGHRFNYQQGSLFSLNKLIEVFGE